MYLCEANLSKYIMHLSVTLMKRCNFPFSHGTAELFTDTQQNTVFKSVGSYLFGISGSMRGACCSNSFVGSPDALCE